MALGPQERRQSRRIRIGQPLKVRPSDPRDEHFEELNVTTNVSRDGLYLISELGSYYEGMRLFLTVPYHSPSEPMDQEYLGQVTRLEARTITMERQKRNRRKKGICLSVHRRAYTDGHELGV